MKTRLALLALLLVVIGGLVYYRVVPKRAELAGALDPSGATGVRFSPDRRLGDGSFNPNPRRKRAPREPASEIGDEWRSRYAAHLDRETPGPVIYVYPFLDLTKRGVGITNTWGWRPVGTAALALWTDARSIDLGPPEHYGLPTIDPSVPDSRSTPEEWRKRVLADPATDGADYVVTGFYVDAAEEGKIDLRIELIESAESAAGESAIVLERQVEVSPSTAYSQLAALQREAARGLADKLIKLGIAQSSLDAESPDLDLIDELDGVALLLDSNDAWTVMDGIDRALQLAALFPSDSLPLQAASYGMFALRYMLFVYASSSSYGVDYGLRAFALAQIALAQNPEPSLMHMTWAGAVAPLGHLSSALLGDVTGNDRTAQLPELRGVRQAVLQRHDLIKNFALTAVIPDWQTLAMDMHWTRYGGTSSPQRDFLEERTQYAEENDFFKEAVIASHVHRGYVREGENHFVRKQKAAALGTAATVSMELATLLLALADRPELGGLASEIARRTGLEAADLKRHAAAGDYFALRRLIAEDFEDWTQPSEPYHPAFGLLSAAEEAAEAALGDPRIADAPSGFAGMEFSLAERVRLAVRRDMLGPTILSEFYAYSFGSYEALVGTMSTYLDARPTNAAAHSDFLHYLERYLEEPGAAGHYFISASRLRSQFPLDTTGLLKLGGYHLRRGKDDTARIYLRELVRIDPFAESTYKELGDLCRKFGYHGDAVRFYAKYTEKYPRRFDVANERAWSLCEMGQYEDPEIRMTFHRGIESLPGNSTFHIAYIAYLRDWVKDYPAARAATDFYIQWKGEKALLELARIEIAAGDNEAALKALGRITGSDKEGLALSSLLAGKGRIYIELGRLDLAEPHIRQAAEIDSWQGAVIWAMGDLATAKGDFERAIGHFERMIDRYGSRPGYDLAIAKIYRKKGEPGRAVEALQRFTVDAPPTRFQTFLVPELMSLYAELDQGDEARVLMNRMLTSASRTRGWISQSLETYRKFEPEQAEEIWGRIDEIMGGPSFLAPDELWD